MFRKITLLSLLSTVIPVMGMTNEPPQRTPQQKYSEEDYNSFIDSNYSNAESKSTEFLQGFIRFIKNRPLTEQSIMFAKFVYALTDPNRVEIFSGIVPKIRDEILDLPLETILFSDLIPTLVGFKKAKVQNQYFNCLLNCFEKKCNENLSTLNQSCSSLLKKIAKHNPNLNYTISCYISSCATLKLKPSKEMLQKIPTAKLLATETTDESIIERARAIRDVEEYKKLLEEGQSILSSNPTLLCVERNIKKIKKYYKIISDLQQLSLKPTIEQIRNFDELFQKINANCEFFQEELLLLNPLTLLQNNACHELLAKNLKSTDFEKIFQEACEFNVQGKLAEFCLNNKIPTNDWAAYALKVLDPNEPALIQRIKKAVNDKEKKDRKKMNQRLNKAIKNETLPNNNEQEPSIVSSVPSSEVHSFASSINTLEFGNRLDSFNQPSKKTITQLSSEEKAEEFETKIGLLYKALELNSAEDFQFIPHSFEMPFYNHAKAHTITTKEASHLEDIKILNANDPLAKKLALEELMENRRLLTAFILPESDNPSDGFIRYVQETLLANSDKIDTEERSFEEREGIYIGMTWKTNTPFNYVEFTKDKGDFVVQIKESCHFTGALDEKGNPLTIYPVESLEEGMNQLSLSETEKQSSFKKKTYQEKK